MQTVQRYLINQLVIAYISGYHGRNSKVYDRRLTLHRGVSNPISFTFKNEDQKAQDITSKTYELNIVDTESKKAVLTKQLGNLNTMSATGLEIVSDGSSTGTTATASVTNTNVTGSFKVGFFLDGTTISGPVEITNVNSTNAAGTETILTLKFNPQTIPSETVNVTAGPKGSASCTITDGDLLKLDAKFYNFSVSDVTDSNNPEITYSDTGYSASGTIEVLDGAYAQHTSSTSISTFTLSGDMFTSSAITGRPGINNNEALHTIAIYPNKFSGTVTVQGTMVSDPQNDNDYFTITSTTFSNASDVTTLNFTGVFQNVRFKALRSSSTTGRIDKILYRQ